jgi:hypothetical protein
VREGLLEELHGLLAAARGESGARVRERVAADLGNDVVLG